MSEKSKLRTEVKQTLRKQWMSNRVNRLTELANRDKVKVLERFFGPIVDKCKAIDREINYASYSTKWSLDGGTPQDSLERLDKLFEAALYLDIPPYQEEPKPNPYSVNRWTMDKCKDLREKLVLFIETFETLKNAELPRDKWRLLEGQVGEEEAED